MLKLSKCFDDLKLKDGLEHIKEKTLEKIRIYDLAICASLSRKEISALKESYYILKKQPEMFSEIKKSIGDYEDLFAVLDNVCDTKEMHSITDSYRIEFLKDTFDCYSSLSMNVKYFGVPASYIMGILPSKKFVEDSVLEAKRLNAAKNDGSLFYVSAEDLIYFRSLYGRFEKELYPKAKPNEKIFVSYTERGRKVYTSFTKAEYEEDLEKAIQLRKKKGPGYVGW